MKVAVLYGQMQPAPGTFTLSTGDFGLALLLAGCITGDAAFPTLDVF